MNKKQFFEQFAQALPLKLQAVLPQPEPSQDDILTYNHYSQVWGMATAPQTPLFQTIKHVLVTNINNYPLNTVLTDTNLALVRVKSEIFLEPFSSSTKVSSRRQQGYVIRKKLNLGVITSAGEYDAPLTAPTELRLNITITFNRGTAFVRNYHGQELFSAKIKDEQEVQNFANTLANKIQDNLNQY